MFIVSISLPFNAKASSAGTLEYSDTENRYVFHDGLNWYLFSTEIVTLSSCSNTAEMNYDYILKTFTICNGSRRRLVLGTITLSPCSQEGTIDYRNNSFMFCNGLLWVNMKGLLL